MQRVRESLQQVPQAQLAVISSDVYVCVCVIVSSGHDSRHPCLARQQHGTQPRGGGHHHQGACSQVSLLLPRA